MIGTVHALLSTSLAELKTTGKLSVELPLSKNLICNSSTGSSTIPSTPLFEYNRADVTLTLSVLNNFYSLFPMLNMCTVYTVYQKKWRQNSNQKVYGGKDLLKSQVLSSEWNTERVRDDASGDSGEGEDDELQPCVIGERAGDCVWRGSRRSVGSLFHREGAAYLKERFVIFKEEWVGRRARVTIDEEHVLCRLISTYT